MKKSTKIVSGLLLAGSAAIAICACIGKKNRDQLKDQSENAENESVNENEAGEENMSRRDMYLSDAGELEDLGYIYVAPDDDYRLEDHVERVNDVLKNLYDVDCQNDYNKILNVVGSLSGIPLFTLVHAYREAKPGYNKVKLETPVTIVDYDNGKPVLAVARYLFAE